MSNASQRYLLAQRLPAVRPALAFLASHPARPGHFRVDIPAGLEPPAQQAYLRDRQVVAELQHPNILPLVETAALPDGTPICVSRWPEGSTLQARLAAGSLAPAAARAIVAAVGDALAAAHARGIVHGRVRADQVLIAPPDGPAGGPWLFGFGARHLLDLGFDFDAGRARDLADLAGLAADTGPGETPRPRIRHWVGLGAGAALGAALTALVALPVRPVTALAEPETRAPSASPPAPPAPPVAVERAAEISAPAADPPPAVTPAPRPRSRPAPPVRARRGLVWSARAQQLVRVDAQGLVLP